MVVGTATTGAADVTTVTTVTAIVGGSTAATATRAIGAVAAITLSHGGARVAPGRRANTDSGTGRGALQPARRGHFFLSVVGPPEPVVDVGQDVVSQGCDIGLGRRL